MIAVPPIRAVMIAKTVRMTLVQETRRVTQKHYVPYLWAKFVPYHSIKYKRTGNATESMKISPQKIAILSLRVRSEYSKRGIPEAIGKSTS